MIGTYPHLSTRRLYLYGQGAGWGAFLLLRLFITGLHCAKTPGCPLLAACLLEIGAHLAGAAWSHVTWMWINRRNLIDRGIKRLVGEGLLVANLGTIPLVLAVWSPVQAIYMDDFSRFGTSAMLGMLIGQNTIIAVLWFWSFVALLYFDRARRFELDHAEARAIAHEAQLHALRGQINPHFLFNSFNSLRALITLDPIRAADALTQLSALLRYSLTSAERLVVPLSEELLIVQRYLDLEKLRLGARLAVVSQVAPHPDQVLIPPLLLQGLVENAVKFGPASRKAGGELTYSVALAHSRLHIRVTNPGRLLADSSSTGLGLRNLRDRLRLLYNTEATFTLREEPGELVVAEVALPARPPERQASADVAARAAEVRKPILGSCLAIADTAAVPPPLRSPAAAAATSTSPV